MIRTLRTFSLGCSFHPRSSSCAGGQDVPLLAPVRITMRASVSSGSHKLSVPTCSYYNEDVGAWDAAGLATESLSSSSDDGGEKDVNLTCLSFHLSDFTVSADAVDAAFRPVSLVSEIRCCQPRDIHSTGQCRSALGLGAADKHTLTVPPKTW